MEATFDPLNILEAALMIASTPPTCCRCVLRLSREEKTHSSRPNIYREEKGEHFWSKKLIPQILLQHIWSIWLVSGHYKKIWDSSFWNQPKSKVNILLWKRHGCARGIRSTTLKWICMKYFRFGVNVETSIWQSQPALNQGGAVEGGIMQEFEVTFPPRPFKWLSMPCSVDSTLE